MTQLLALWAFMTQPAILAIWLPIAAVTLERYFPILTPVLEAIESKLGVKNDPTAHPLFNVILAALEKKLPAPPEQAEPPK